MTPERSSPLNVYVWAELANPALAENPVSCPTEIDSLGFLIFRLRVFVSLPTALKAVSVTAKEPETVGVPVIRPEVGCRERPSGSPSAKYEVGLLLTVI